LIIILIGFDYSCRKIHYIPSAVILKYRVDTFHISFINEADRVIEIIKPVASLVFKRVIASDNNKRYIKVTEQKPKHCGSVRKRIGTMSHNNTVIFFRTHCLYCLIQNSPVIGNNIFAENIIWLYCVKFNIDIVFLIKQFQ
jgi:hypothetical protein